MGLLTRLRDIRQNTLKIPALQAAAVADYLETHLYRNPKYADPRGLTRYERQTYSQGGEDGIIAEIVRRIGAPGKTFAEFGVTDGLECNTTFLLAQGWRGTWIDGDRRYLKAIARKFGFLMDEGKLKVLHAFITRENIEGLFREAQVPTELDFLSIDIDGNDYWVWKALSSYRPRAVVIEYNAFFGPEARWVMRYNPDHVWNRQGTYYGASLKSLELLGREMGYTLVGASFTCTNAFFVRDDLVGDHFLPPFTSEALYEPPRYFLLRRNGHASDFGPFEIR